ncbi:MAG: molybdate ABC transporter permease subunit [Thiotrichales bacterium]|nr:molybdate ABC transporter permease subunit [Thiotrichales bacterium]MBT3612714.1 molybdate ABC transporter permease subunit [Thiotrichales bacterium]MBT3837111.1 molybdate ABC transporter permease subunit [Thiotrichales bacterium]MBT4574222.1 molybdate ABC transporter permease subunit [Thiotrichales bacterium]MBT5290503.1 molybdate ABC transporter permease subunit [Thiotrichales bacterium]
MVLSSSDLSALIVTVELAALTTIILLIIGTPLAWWLSQTKWRFRGVVDAIIALPIVLPPTVLGFYMLVAMGRGGVLEGFAFTFSGLVIGSVIYSLPFVVQPLQNSFAAIGSRPLEVAATLRASPLDRFFTTVIPLAKRGFMSAIALGFAHTVGEFGVVLMIGGNIPGETQVLSIAIYEHVEALEYAQAHTLSAGLLMLSFIMLLLLYSSPLRKV